MAVVIASNLRKELAGSVLFDGVSFSVERRDRVALSGPNGAGKTTLLRILSGETEKHGGELAFQKGTRVALHDQRPPLERDVTLREYVGERVRAIAAAEIVDPQRLKTAEALVHGISLRGDGLATWQAQLATYPELLAERIAEDAAATWHEVPRSELTLLRPGERLVLVQRLVEDAENVLRLVFALNRTWQQGWKHLATVLEPLALQPEGLAAGIDAALAGGDLRAMRELVSDTLALAPGSPAVERARAEVAALLERLP